MDICKLVTNRMTNQILQTHFVKKATHALFHYILEGRGSGRVKKIAKIRWLRES
jgi:hypothetical protein